MNDKIPDIIIAGSGPIAAATAYHLVQTRPNLTILLVTEEPTESFPHSSTYHYAGGSLRWHWDDPLKQEMTQTTANFISQLLEQGVDLSALRDHYLLAYTGQYTPSINFSGAKLVDHLLEQARSQGLTIQENTTVRHARVEDGQAMLETSRGPLRARRALLALGVANAQVLPTLDLEIEKRQLFVTNVPVDDTRRDFPHLIVPIKNGYAYAFIKQTPDGPRFIVGQEDVVETNSLPEPEDYFTRLLDAGVGDIMPFLREAEVETIWWGFDASNKTLKLEDREGVLLAANCGSAARSCAWIGRDLAGRLTAPTA